MIAVSYSFQLGIGRWNQRFVSSRFLTRAAAAQVSISDAFDGGNIQLQEITQTSGNTYTVKLEIKPDVFTELEQKSHFQYFAFRSTVSDLPTDETATVTYSIENASEASYAVAWEDSTTCYT